MTKFNDMLSDEFREILRESTFDERNGMYNVLLSEEEAQRILNTLKIYDETVLPNIPIYHRMNQIIDDIIELTGISADQETIGKLFTYVGQLFVNKSK